MKSSRLWLALLAALLAGLVITGAVAAYTFAREVVVADSGQDERLSDVTINCNRAEWLVVWQVDTGGGDTDILGRRARSIPGFEWLGDAFAIAATTSPERAARVAYNPLDDDFLVVYERKLLSDDVDVMGQRVAGWQGGGDNGPDLRGGAFAIGASIGQETTPAVAFLPATQQFLVAYELNEDIRGRRVARYHMGTGGGETLGPTFIVAADPFRAEGAPAVTASEQQAYFLVAYTYEFTQDESDVRGQRLKGSSTPGAELLGTAFDIANTTDDETQPDLAYSQNWHALLAVWTATAAGNSDVRGLWLDEYIQSGDPAMGPAFDTSANPIANEMEPQATSDPITGNTAVTMIVVPVPGAVSRVGLVWLQPDPLALNHIMTPRFTFPERPFSVSTPRLSLCPNRPGLLIGYSARFGGSLDYQYDAQLLAGGQWSAPMPLVQR